MSSDLESERRRKPFRADRFGSLEAAVRPKRQAVASDRKEEDMAQAEEESSTAGVSLTRKTAPAPPFLQPSVAEPSDHMITSAGGSLAMVSWAANFLSAEGSVLLVLESRSSWM